ncbi:MAG: hypothetical protein WD533_08625 [Dehalococcoidia bacterium]
MLEFLDGGAKVLLSQREQVAGRGLLSPLSGQPVIDTETALPAAKGPHVVDIQSARLQG